MKALFATVVVFALFAFTVHDRLTGRWETNRSENGNVTGVVFNPDNSFEGYVNNKPFVSGKYTLVDSIFSFVDNGCDGRMGIYKVIFFSGGDSLRFEHISDSCEERKNGMSRTILGRKN